MTNAIFMAPTGEWSRRVRSLIAERVTILDLDPEFATTALGTTHVDLVFMEAEFVTDLLIASLHQTRAAYPNCAVVCIAPDEVAERAGDEGTLVPDFWVVVPAVDGQLRAQIAPILACVEGNQSSPTALSRPATGLSRQPGILDTASGRQPQPENVISRAVGRMTGSFDVDKLFAACCDAVQQLTGCVSYCLLWHNAERRRFEVARCEGLSPEIEETCHFATTSALPSLIQQHRGLVTRDMLSQAPEDTPALRELEMCGGVLAMPVSNRGTLRGIIILGPKAIGEPYLVREVETLMMLSASMAAAVRQGELHRELELSNNYIDQILQSMASGIVTLGVDGKIRVCNPCAARALQLDVDGTIGQDIRVLPSPLGDYLYACLRYGEERSRDEVNVSRGAKSLRVSTRRLMDQAGDLIGSMMLVEDISAEKALAEEKRRAERNAVISQIVARFAHELKNPLATIRTFTELLPTRYEDPEFHQFCTEHVARDVHRLDDLVAKLVSLAEPPHPTRELVAVPELLQLAVDRVGLLDEDAPESIQVIPNGTLPQVRVDTNTMAAALAHLLRYGLGPERNAVSVKAELQAGPDGEQPVAISIRATADDQNGIDPRLILEPSYVIDHPNVDLGPSASQRLIESQGGALDAYREDGEMVFRISLIPDAADGTGLTPEE